MRKRVPKAKAITRLGRWKQPFLESLAQTGNVTVSAERAGVERKTVYNTKDRDKEFNAAIIEAKDKAADLIEHALRERAVHGVTNYVVRKGVLVFVPVDKDGNIVHQTDATFVKNVPLVKREFDTTAGIFLLKGLRPETYRDSHHHTHDGQLGLRTTADGESESAQLLDEIRQSLGAQAGTPPAV